MEAICNGCGHTNTVLQNVPVNLTCQICGSPYITLNETATAECVKCGFETKFIKDDIKFIVHENCDCLIYIFSSFKEKEKAKSIRFNKKRSKPAQKLKVIIPYYEADMRTKRALSTWLLQETVFALTDELIIPPGSGICSQVYIERNSANRGIGSKRLPFFTDLIDRLIRDFPDEDYYGYVNSDIILPLGKPVQALLPEDNKLIAVHHRLDVKGSDYTKVKDLKKDNVIVVGKDAFFFTREVAEKIVEKFPNMIIGYPFWDTSLSLFLWEEYGWDRIDFRYREIYHAKHRSNDNMLADYDTEEGTYNREQSSKFFKKHYSGQVWTDVCTESKGRTETRETLGLIQPGRLGDIIICLPIAKYYYDRGYEVHWPVQQEFLHIFDRINYVNAIEIHKTISEAYEESKVALNAVGVDKVIDLAIGFGRKEGDWKRSGLSFDEWKYSEAKVPLREKYDLQYVKNEKAENALIDLFDLEYTYKTGYFITHSKSSFAMFDFGIPDAIEFCNIEGFHFFDWAKLIDNATGLYCVDSCLANFANQAGLAEGKRYIKTWHGVVREDHADANRRTPTLAGDWQQFRYFTFKDQVYPNYINDGNGTSHCIDLALKYCKGSGVDLGGGDNPLPGSVNLDMKTGYKDLHTKEAWHGISKKLDYVYSSHFLEHNEILQQTEILYQAYRHLKTGGKLFLYLPHPGMQYWNQEENPLMCGEYGHKHIADCKQLRSDLEEIGFEVIEYSEEPDHYWSYFIAAEKKKPVKKKKRKEKQYIIGAERDFKIATITIAYNAIPFIEYSLNMCKQFADQVIVVEGAIEEMAKIDDAAYSNDGTKEYLEAKAVKNEIDLICKDDGSWQDKIEMQNKALELVDADYVWLVDADEFYYFSDIEQILNLIEERKPAQINFQAINYFKGKDYIITGGRGRFKTNSSRIQRIFKFEDKHARFINHRPPTLNADSRGELITSIEIVKNFDIYMHHFGYIFNSQVEQKVKLYERILKEDHSGMRAWYENFFILWTPQNRKQLENEAYGVWYPDDKTVTEKNRHGVPEVLKGFPWGWEEGIEIEKEGVK